MVKLTIILLPFLFLCLAVTTLIRCQQLMPRNLNPQVTNRNFPTVMLNGGGDGSALPPPPPGFTLVPTFAGPFLVPITQERRQPLPSPSSASVRPSTSQLPPQNGLQNLFQPPVATPQPSLAASNHGVVNFRNGNGNAGGDHQQMPPLFMAVNDRRPPVDEVFNPFLQVQPEFPFHHDQQQQHQQLQSSTSGSQGQRFSQPLPPSGTSRPHTNEHLAAVFQTPSQQQQQQRPASNNFSPELQDHQNVQTPSSFFHGANDQDQRGQLGLFQADIGPNNIMNGATSGSSPQMNNLNFGGGQESPLPTDGGGQMTTTHNPVPADAAPPGTTSMLTLVDFVPSTNTPSTHYFIGLGPTISDRPNNDNNGAEHERPPSTIFHVETPPSSSPTTSAKPSTTISATTIAPLPTETPPTTHFWVEMTPQFNADNNPIGQEAVDSGGLSEPFLSSNGRPPSTSETSVIFPREQQQRLPEDVEVFRPATPSPANPHIQEQGPGAEDEQQFEQEHQQPELPFVNHQQTTSGGGSSTVTFPPPTNDPNEGAALWTFPEVQTPQSILNHNLNNQNLNQDNNKKDNNHHGQQRPSSTTLNEETPRDNNVNNVHLESTISSPPEQSIIIGDGDHGSSAFQEELSTSSNGNGGHQGPFRNDAPPSTRVGVTFPTTLQEVSEDSSRQELTTPSSPSSSLPTTRRQKQEQLELMQSPGFVAILNGLQRNRSKLIASSNEDQLQRPQATTIRIPSERTTTARSSSSTPKPTSTRKVQQRVTRPLRGRLATRRFLIRRTSLKTRKTTTTAAAAPRTTTSSPTTIKTTAAELVTEQPSSSTLHELPTTSGELLTMMRDVVTPSPTDTSSSLHDNNNHFPSPPADTPEVGSDAILCDPSKCRLPHCFCGGNQLIPGDLDVSQVPQMVLLTFDDSVNEINYAFYSTLLNDEGRKNPNGCPISATFYVSHEWTDYGKIQTLYAQGHEIASHSITHSDGAPFTEERWLKEIYGQKRILSALGGVRTDDIRGMRAPFLQGGGNKQFAMLRDANFTYDSSIPSHVNNPPTWPYTFDYRMPHACGIPPCPTKSYPGVWEVPMVMWEDLKRGHCAMADACQNPTDARGVYDMLVKNFKRHYTSNRAPFGMFYHYAWFTHEHQREGFLAFIEAIMQLPDVYMVTNSQLIEWMRQPTPLSRIADFEPWQCAATRAAASSSRPAATTCSRPKRCSYRFRGDERQFPTCQPCPDKYPWLDSYDELHVIR